MSEVFKVSCSFNFCHAVLTITNPESPLVSKLDQLVG